MRVLVTGAGMVGCFLARQLCDAGHEVALLELSPNVGYIETVVGRERARLVRGNILHVPDVVGAMQACRAERVVHTAALLGASVEQAPYNAVHVNLLGLVNVLEAAAL